MAKLASFLLKLSISRPVLDFTTFAVASFDGITILNKNLTGNRLGADIDDKDWQKKTQNG